jgi:hypothetical protein
MPNGFVGTLTDGQARAFAAALEVQTEKAANAVGGWVEQSVVVAGVPTHFGFTDSVIAQASMPAFASGGTAEWAPVTIRVWDSGTTGVAPPPPDWDWHANRYQSNDVIVTYDRQRRRLTLVDTATRSAIYWIASSSSWPPWEHAAPFRDVLDRLLAPTGHVFLHAGTLGDDHVTVLLAGPSGSGKSTTTAAGAAAGFTTLGDDYVVLDPDGEHLHALYGIVRLLPTSPAVGDCAANGVVDHQGKLVVSLTETGHSPVRGRSRLVAVVTPTVGTGTKTATRPTSAAAALKALAPTSLVQMDPRAESLRQMRELVERMPCYAMELGADLPDALAHVQLLLDRHR